MRDVAPPQIALLSPAARSNRGARPSRPTVRRTAMNRFVRVVAWTFLAMLIPASSSAQVGNPFDHLKCYKIKDPTKAAYVADLVPLQRPPFSVEPGCKVLFPPKLFCIPVQKTNVQPQPPGAVNGI